MGFAERLVEERDRLGLKQNEFAEQIPVTARAQRNYEKGEREPDACYLAAVAKMGVDVLYLITGQRSANALSEDERQLLALFRAASLPVKMAAVGALQGAALSGASQTNTAEGSVMIGIQHGGKNKITNKKG